MSELYICIDCELASEDAVPAALNIHGMCATCGSSSVIPVAKLAELLTQDKKEKLDAPLRETTDAEHQKRVQAMKDKRFADSLPIREYLKTKFTLPPPGVPSLRAEQTRQLHACIDAWDGWSWVVHYPWVLRVSDEDENPIPGCFCIELVNGSKNSPRFAIALDSEINDVRSF
jgi:hypothetical protein